VREFLEDRLRREIGGSGVDELHVRIAQWAEPHDWHTSAYHFATARHERDLVRVIDAHLATIVGAGAFATASELYKSVRSAPDSAGIEVIESRLASRDGSAEAVLRHATLAAQLDPTNEVVTANLVTANVIAGDLATALAMATTLAESGSSPLMRRHGHAAATLFKASIDGDVVDAATTFLEVADESRAAGHGHYEGVSELNAAIAFLASGRFDDALAHALASIDALMGTSSGAELKSALYAKAAALAFKGDMTSARAVMTEAGIGTRHLVRVEYLTEYADFEAQLGSLETARDLLAGIDQPPTSALDRPLRLASAVVALRGGEAPAALEALLSIDRTVPGAAPGLAAKTMAWTAFAAAVARRPDAHQLAADAAAFAARQRAGVWEAMSNLIMAALSGHLESALVALPERLTCAMSLCAELVVEQVGILRDDARERVVAEARRRPDRWLPAVRAAASDTSNPNLLASARFLADVGTTGDVSLLARIAKLRVAAGDRHLARELARRLAPRVVIHDLGRVTIQVGDRHVPGQDLRRKVLALLCFLLTRPRFSATREEVMEAMWPDIKPIAAVNSLNQSVYFLRRVFESEYSDEASAGYVRQDSDLIWLDTDLISSVSNRCAQLVAEYERTGAVESAIALSHEYTERFALDFAYEEWAGDHRDWLHVSCLRVLEGQVRAFVDSGAFEAGVAMARRALDADPRNEDLEASLLRLLRNYGAHAAAAEQYSRYSTLLKRDLGVEPPPPDQV
jgi:DNA-binding SARP family transcriptional activator